MTFGFKRFCVSGAMAVSVLVSSASASWAESLADTLVAAYKHSGLIEQNRAVLRAADEGVAQAMADLRPVLSWSAGVQRTFGKARNYQQVGEVPAALPILPSTPILDYRTTGFASHEATLRLLASLTLYAGGSNRLKVEAAKETVLATRADLLAIEQQVLFRAVGAFMEMRRAYDTVALRQNGVRVIQQEVRAAKDRFEVGEVTRTDVALAQARLAQGESALAAAKGQLVIAQEEFRAAVGRKPGSLQTPKGAPRLPRSVDAAKKQAVRSHPDMISVQHQVAGAELAIKIAEASLKPRVTLDGSYGVTTDDDDTNRYTRSGTIGLSATGTIYSGGKIRSAIREARANRDRARGGLHVVRHAVIQNVGNSYVQLDVARASREAFEAQVRAAQVAFRGVREEAKLGARTTLDVLDAEQDLIDARTNLISAQVDEVVASYAILASLGQLTAEALHLDVPQYDAAEYYNLVKSAPSATSKQGRELDRVLRAMGKE